MPAGPRTHHLLLSFGLGVTAVALAGCGQTTDAANAGRSGSGGVGAVEGSVDGTVRDTADHGRPSRPRVTSNLPRRRSNVPVSTVLQVNTDSGRLRTVRVTSAEGTVPGSISVDRSRWQAREGLDPATSYTLVAVADRDGVHRRQVTHFRTSALSLDEQTYPTVLPADDSTVGIGMPVVVRFDVPVQDRATFERGMHVSSSPAQRGSWHWMSSTEARWRPAHYWSPGTTVSVDLDLNGLPAGDGVYGQESRHQTFRVGDAHILKVDARTHQMRVFDGGKLIRTIPITTGKPGYTTRSGIKVIVEKFTDLRMNSETVGIGGSEAYDLDDVKWDLRLTYSGEFIHAAPWSVGSQGYANVSHGCTGLSTENAEWLYGFSQVGDVVVTTGTDKPMTLENGLGDWNESFRAYRNGSAL